MLQYPVCLIVVSSDYARFYGVRTGLWTVELSGDGWAVGTMLQPAAVGTAAHFTRDFSRATGMPPGWYLTDQ